MLDGLLQGSRPMAITSLMVYVTMLLTIVVLGHYLLFYVVFILAFLLLAFNIRELGSLRQLERKSLLDMLLIVFLLALLVRLLLLFQDQVLTNDILSYVRRSEKMMAGLVPYQDFNVNKPPLYAFMLHAMGVTMGAGELQFRAFFSVVDSLVAVVVYHLCRCRYPKAFSLWASMAYALCPLPIVSIGLSGHYEPVVMLPVLLSLFFLLKKRYHLSALLLGIGFALKFFPIILLPFFAWRIKDWKGRLIYLVLFSVPMVLSIIPMVLMSPDAFWAYMYEQGFSWPAKKSFAWCIELLAGTDQVLGVKITLLTSLLFMGGILAMFVSWARDRFEATAWFKVIVVAFAVLYGLQLVASERFYMTDQAASWVLLVMSITALVYFPITLGLLYRYHHKLDIEVKVGGRQEIFVISAFAIFLLIFSSDQYNVWYLLWPLPFLLATRNKKVMYVLLLLMFWNFEGKGISLLPGIDLG